MVCGHETLMKIIDYMRGRGVQPERYLFMPTNKTFGFGGDASRQADWSVRLPVYLSGKAGYMECVIVEGATPLLIGRPILQALKLQMNYELDDGVENDPTGSYVDFDFVTNETYAAISNYEDLENYIDVHEYLSTTNRTPPETAFQTEEPETNTIEIDSPDAPAEDPTEIRRPITDKLVKSLHMNFNKFSKQRRTVMEQALHAHESGRKVFWEVYSGSANLSTAMAQAGWEIMSFDYNTGWDFTIGSHRREFLQLLDATCPEFVWMAPPCTIWSNLQNLTPMTPQRQLALQTDRDLDLELKLPENTNHRCAPTSSTPSTRSSSTRATTRSTPPRTTPWSTSSRHSTCPRTKASILKLRINKINHHPREFCQDSIMRIGRKLSVQSCDCIATLGTLHRKSW